MPGQLRWHNLQAPRKPLQPAKGCHSKRENPPWPVPAAGKCCFSVGICFDSCKLFDSAASCCCCLLNLLPIILELNPLYDRVLWKPRFLPPNLTNPLKPRPKDTGRALISGFVPLEAAGASREMAPNISICPACHGEAYPNERALLAGIPIFTTTMAKNTPIHQSLVLNCNDSPRLKCFVNQERLPFSIYIFVPCGDVSVKSLKFTPGWLVFSTHPNNIKSIGIMDGRQMIDTSNQFLDWHTHDYTFVAIFFCKVIMVLA